VKGLNDSLGVAPPTRRFPVRLVLFGAAGAIAFQFGFLAHSPVEAGWLVQHFGYWVMGLTFLWWVVALTALGRRPEAGWRETFYRHRAAWALIAGLTLVATLTLSYSYKVLYDELVLQASASNLHFLREFGTILRGYDVEGVFRSVEIYVDKRPFFYPFVVSLVHDLTGYREANAYLVNTALLPISLVLLYTVFRKIGSSSAALAGLACFGASSLLVQNANGSGMELLNLAMISLTLWLAIDYLERPEENRLSALVLSTVLLAQTRYESALYVVSAGLVVFEGWRRAGRIMLPAAALFAPFLLLPCALHNTYLSGMPALWELKEDISSRFAAKYLFDNLGHARSFLFDLSGKQLNSWWLAAVGLPALGWAAQRIVRRGKYWREASPAVVACVLFSAAALANLLLLMFYFWGQLDDPIVARLVLPFYVVLALCIVWATSRFEGERCQTLSRWLVGGALITYLAVGLQATAFNADRNQLATEIKWEEKWVAAQPVRSRLVITNKSTLNWVVQRVSSISVTRARNTAKQIQFHLAHGTFQEVLVTQYLRPIGAEGGFQLDPHDELPATYVLEPLIERQLGARLLRISRVVEIRLPKERVADHAVTPVASSR
jgi:hypothetical protein